MMNNTNAIATREPKVTLETVTVYDNIRLEGLTLKLSKISTEFEITRIFNPRKSTNFELASKVETSKEISYLSLELVEVTTAEISKYRKKKIPSFILKKDGKVFYTKIPADLSLYSAKIFENHKCSKANHECRRLSAAIDELGGCAKVRNQAKYIEKYPWIINGYETFGTATDAFFGATCLHYTPCDKKISEKTKLQTKFSLA